MEKENEKKYFICEICHQLTPTECEGSEPNTCADCMPLYIDKPKTKDLRVEGKLDDVFVISSFEKPLRTQISSLKHELKVYRVALRKMANQLNHVYDYEGCVYGDELGNKCKDEKSLTELYLKDAEENLAELEEIFKEVDENNGK